MHRLMLLLAVLLPVAGHAGIRAAAPDDIANQYFQIACELSKLDCTGISAPLLLAIDTPPGLMGFHYYGTNTVYVTDRCFLDVADKTKCDGVIIHEMVHYIASERGMFQDDSCANEALAWKVFNLFVLDRGREDLVRGNWRESYPQCREKLQ